MIQQKQDWHTKITDVQSPWLRVPLDRPIADSTHQLKAIDLILVSVHAGEWIWGERPARRLTIASEKHEPLSTLMILAQLGG